MSRAQAPAEVIDCQLKDYFKVLSEYEPTGLFENWFKLLRAAEELSNLPMELDNFFDYMMLQLDLSDQQNQTAFQDMQLQIIQKYSSEINERFTEIFTMCGKFPEMGDTISSVIEYFQARRVHFAATLLLIPHICKGTKKIPFTETLNELLPALNNHLVNLPAAYFSLLSDGEPEDRFVQTIWMALSDQGAFSEPDYYDGEYHPFPAGRAHSYVNIDNTLLQFSTANGKYGLSDSVLYQQVQSLATQLEQYNTDDYTIRVPVAEFEVMAKDLMPFLILADSDYYNAMNSSAPFVILNGFAHTSVTLLTAFINQLHAKVLSRSKDFQMASAALFEKKVSDTLADNEFIITNTTRINQKEFDLIATKNGITCTFHCKNNPIDVVKVKSDFKNIERLNRLRVKRYESALGKGHFVISRFPVISLLPGIINFSVLDDFLKEI